MGVASHLGIRLDEYDARIRTFIPQYETMLDAASKLVAGLRKRSPVILDLGIGSGALSARCLSRVPSARVIGIDEDEGMLGLARARLGPGLTTIAANFLSANLPRCDAIVASLALHHVPTPALKSALFERCFTALRPGGLMVSADCYLAPGATARTRHRQAWRRHLMKTYSRQEATGFLRAWAREDTYFTLTRERAMFHGARFASTVHWRRGSFAVIAGYRGRDLEIVDRDHKHRPSRRAAEE